MHGDDILDRLAQIVVNSPAQTNRRHDRTEIIVQQYNRRRFTRHVRAPTAHGDADMGRLDGRRVIHAVSGHGDNVAPTLQAFHDTQFLRRPDAREDRGRREPIREVLVGQLLDVLARQHPIAIQPCLSTHGAGGERVVSGDHDHANAGGLAFGNRCGNIGSQGIGEAHEPQIVEPESTRRLRQLGKLRLRDRRGSRNGEHTDSFLRHRIGLGANIQRGCGA